MVDLITDDEILELFELLTEFKESRAFDLLKKLKRSEHGIRFGHYIEGKKALIGLIKSEDTFRDLIKELDYLTIFMR